jgi:hypothetical protein
MSKYKIKDYSFKNAKELDVIIKPSTNKNKKIDVFDNGEKVAEIGDINYSDYPTYLITHGKEYANKRRNLYLIRHKKDHNLPGLYARLILW